MDELVIGQKPTIEQIAWVCKCFIANATQCGTYRNLLYDIMELDESSYTTLQLAGALEINNALAKEVDNDKG